MTGSVAVAPRENVGPVVPVHFSGTRKDTKIFDLSRLYFYIVKNIFLSDESGLRILNVRKNGAVLQKKAPGGDLQLVKNTQFWVLL